MLRKIALGKAILSSGTVFAHIKPFPHSHIGLFHPEDVVVILGVLVGTIGAGYLVYRLVKKTA